MPVLPPLRNPFHGAIALEHVKETIGSIESPILGREFIINVIIGLAIKVVDVRLVNRWSWKAYERTSSKGNDRVRR